MTIKSFIGLSIYYGFAWYLPSTRFPLIGTVSGKLRAFCCRLIFNKCGKNITIERKAFFGNGRKIEIGDNSGIGTNAQIPFNTIIGDNVMMGPNVVIFYHNHEFSATTKPMCQQGYKSGKQTIIGNDVWIGQGVYFTPGRKISDGCVIAAASVVTKDFPKFSIIGGNPARIIKSRENIQTSNSSDNNR